MQGGGVFPERGLNLQVQSANQILHTNISRHFSFSVVMERVLIVRRRVHRPKIELDPVGVSGRTGPERAR